MYSTQTPAPVSHVKFTRHFLVTALSKGFSAEEIHSALFAPEKVTDVLAHPGQKRFIAGRVAVVAEVTKTGATAITCYLDRVVTPVREDQMNTPEGREFAVKGRQRSRR